MPHYLNGREAREGDSVVVKPLNAGEMAYVGILHEINPGATSCNGRVSRLYPGQVERHYVTVGQCLHAQDALSLSEAYLGHRAAATKAEPALA